MRRGGRVEVETNERTSGSISISIWQHQHHHQQCSQFEEVARSFSDVPVCRYVHISVGLVVVSSPLCFGSV
eukprot:11029581-Lingulodinium_polyedra.AAC.1